MELITKSFESQCLAFPSRVETLLATITTVSEAKELLDKATVMSTYAQLRGSVDVARPVAFGVLKIKAKLGELLPAKAPKESGAMKGKKGIGAAPIPFDANTRVAYRKLAKHKDKLEEWYEGIKDVPSQSDFIKIITLEQRAKKEAARESKRAGNRKKVSKAADPLAVGAQFASIVIDPPWDWGDEGDNDQLGRAKPDYATMTIDQLKGLPVTKLADSDCHLYMWITNRSLPKGFDLLEAWGFRYITCLTWPKPSFGMGNYFRGQTEQVLFGVRGSQSLKRKNASTLLPNWKRGDKHSAKPVEFYEFVESCSPGPFLEMFSRSSRDGWTAWGESS